MKRAHSGKNRKKRLMVILIVMVIAISVMANQAKENGVESMRSVVKDPIGAVNKVIAVPKKWVFDRKYSVLNLFDTYEENRKLEEEVARYDEMKRKVTSQSQEIERLEEEVQLKKRLTSYRTLAATVIARSPNAWQNTLMVDKGSQDGVTKNMAVMSQKGLIGRVRKVKEQSCEIELVTSDNRSSNHFPIKISAEDGESFGILTMYDEKKKQLIATQITKEKNIKKGDVVRTSGLGRNSPAGIPIGTIVQVKPSRNGIDLEVYIAPYAQMADVSFVTIIQDMPDKD